MSCPECSTTYLTRCFKVSSIHFGFCETCKKRIMDGKFLPLKEFDEMCDNMMELLDYSMVLEIEKCLLEKEQLNEEENSIPPAHPSSPSHCDDRVIMPEITTCVMSMENIS